MNQKMLTLSCAFSYKGRSTIAIGKMTKRQQSTLIRLHACRRKHYHITSNEKEICFSIRIL